MTDPMSHESGRSCSHDSLVGSSPASTDRSDKADPGVTEQFCELQQQLAIWVREMESSSGPAQPHSYDAASIASDLPLPEDSVEAHIEFLTALSHEELLDAAIELHAERNTLFRQLGNIPDLSQLEEMRGRFQEAVDELESLRLRNQELEAALADKEDASDAACIEGHETDDVGDEEDATDFESDWESQKNRWLDRLQGGEDRDDSIGLTEELKEELQRQARYVQQLESQIEQLQHQLDEKDARDKALDADVEIRAERQRLAELKQVWEAKIREAELELSRERANITRAQQKLVERERTVEALRERLERRQAQSESTNWRGYLGLK